jgi:hypothetical protein
VNLLASLLLFTAPPTLEAAPTVDDVRLFGRPAADSLREHFEKPFKAMSDKCVAFDAGGLGSTVENVKGTAWTLDGVQEPIAVLQATCVMGKVGYETHHWVLRAGLGPVSLGKKGSRAYDDLLVAKDGLVGVTYEKRLQGAPGSCRYTRLRWAKTGLALTAGQQWTREPIGEGAQARCPGIGE